ncbi:MAG: SPOR domain-containing protein [Treponema sp.]|jgi:DedD protein|nr:SPOR domain-containing protein [Treponema sp.]
MEKEQKKLLLVAVSVGVFLLVTITVALVILMPKVQAQEAAFTSSNTIQPGRINPSEIVPLQPVINNSQETNNGASVAIDRNDGDRLTIQIPKPSTAAVPDSIETTASTTAKTPAATVSATTTKKQTTTTQPAAASKQTSSSSTATSRTINDFWVQTGAFTAKVRADDAKELLASKGLTSIIENREIDGKTWYRVRLGPYTSEKEANYWLSLVKSIDGFSESQVRQTARSL